MKRTIIFGFLSCLAVSLMAQATCVVYMKEGDVYSNTQVTSLSTFATQTQHNYINKSLPSEQIEYTYKLRMVHISPVNASYPTYVTASSGDLNPFGANAPRKAPPGTGGTNPNNPGIHQPVPLADAIPFLVVLAMGYGLCRCLRRNEVRETPCDDVSTPRRGVR